MSIDNTHTKYLHGRDKKAWDGYKEALKAQESLDSFMAGFGAIPDLKEGEEFEIPVRKDKGKRGQKKND